MAAKSWILPAGITTPADLGRVIRELEQTTQFMQQAGLRKGGEAVSLPKPSRLMNELCQANNINLLHEAESQQLTEAAAALKQQAPVLQISFSADPSALFLQKLVTWLRQKIHPYMLLRIGLQPNIGAGCIVRTTNRYFDFSLRHLLEQQHHLLSEKLTAMPAEETV